ncbi:MAG: hypothetical protein ACT4NX_05830 [Deltaproteobacteria bacterium]
MKINNLWLIFFITATFLQALPRESHAGVELLAKAPADECFCGIGDSHNGPISASAKGDCSDIVSDTGGACVPKRNQSYIWGLTKSGRVLWFGTAPNVLCTGGAPIGILGSTPFVRAGFVACEFGESSLVPPLPASLGDFRPPRIYTYDLNSKMLEQRSVASCGGADRTALLNDTGGLRSAGSLGNVVFLAGLGISGGINVFAFRADTRACIGAMKLTQFDDIRKWLVLNGILYAAVGNTNGGGSVLRWTGTVASPFQFAVVGNLDGLGANIASHNGRIFVTTWPDIPENVAPSTLVNFGFAGLYASPTVPRAGLTAANAGQWRKVWQATDYEPDRVIAAAYAGGDLASFGGFLYWGTMHFPNVSFLVHAAFREPDTLSCATTHAGDQAAIDECRARRDIARSEAFRTSAIFRGNFDFLPFSRVELLYGDASLPVYSALQGVWADQFNGNLVRFPRFGASGFNNPFNLYTWTMTVFNNQLFVGSFDASILLTGGVQPANNPFGADLLRFTNANSAATPVTLNGFGNITNYGVRTVFSDGDGLFLGTANPFNINRGGGWELLRFTP